MAAIHLTDRERALLERLCEHQGWWDTARKLATACHVCRGLKDGQCSHR